MAFRERTALKGCCLVSQISCKLIDLDFLICLFLFLGYINEGQSQDSIIICCSDFLMADSLSKFEFALEGIKDKFCHYILVTSAFNSTRFFAPNRQNIIFLQ